MSRKLFIVWYLDIFIHKIMRRNWCKENTQLLFKKFL